MVTVEVKVAIENVQAAAFDEAFLGLLFGKGKGADTEKSGHYGKRKLGFSIHGCSVGKWQFLIE